MGGATNTIFYEDSQKYGNPKVSFNINPSSQLEMFYSSSTTGYPYYVISDTQVALSANTTYFVAVMVDTSTLQAVFYVNNTSAAVAMTAANSFAMGASSATMQKNIGAQNTVADAKLFCR